MSLFKKSLLITLALFLGIKCGNKAQPKKLKGKLSRQQNKVQKEVAQIFKNDNQQQIAKEVADVNALATTAQEKQDVKIALQQEIIKETAEIKADLIEAQEDRPRYITYDQAIDIIKSNKTNKSAVFVSKSTGASLIATVVTKKSSSSSWTNSLAIKPFTKTYRLVLRVMNEKEYTALLEKERKSLEHILNVQAHNNIMLLYAALDLKIKQAAAFDIEHMFKKEAFYKVITHAFEGGALLASDIELSKELKDLLADLSILITKNFHKISNNPAVVQSIYEMNDVIWEGKELREGYRIKRGLEEDITYDASTIRKLCTEAAQKNGQVLHIKKSYPQYLKDWISKPKNLVKAGLVMAAIGGLYLYGPAIPAWLKDYANSSIGSIKGSLAKGYQTTISSVKNLWNKVRGNQIQELPDSTESKRDAQEQELSTDEYFVKRSKADAAAIEQKKELMAGQGQAFVEDEFDQQYNQQQHDQGWEQFEGQQIPEADIEYENVGSGIRLNPTSSQIPEGSKEVYDSNDSLLHKLAAMLSSKEESDILISGYNKAIEEKFKELQIANPEIPESILHKQAEAMLNDTLTKDFNKAVEEKLKKLQITNPDIPDTILRKKAEAMLHKATVNAITESYNKKIDAKVRGLQKTNPEIPETNIEYENVGRIRLNPTSGSMVENRGITQEDLIRERILHETENKLDNTNALIAEAKKNLSQAKTNRLQAITSLNNLKRTVEQTQQTNNIDQKTLKDLSEANESIIKGEKILEENALLIEQNESALKELTTTALETQSLILELNNTVQEPQNQILINSQ